MNHVQEAWNDILEKLESRLSRHSFETWLQSAQPIGIYDHELYIEVPDHFFQGMADNSLLINNKSNPERHN